MVPKLGLRLICRKRYVISCVSSVFIFLLFYQKRKANVMHVECNSFPYYYPLENVSRIVRSILLNRTTDVKPINKVSGRFHRIYDVHCHVTTDLVILVKSQIGSFRQRSAIRQTWVKSKGDRVQVVFVLGFSKRYLQYVKAEHFYFKDVIQFSFKDRYRSNIYKTIMSYNWVMSNCRSTKFVFFVDDDFFVNIPNVFEFAIRNLASSANVMYGHRRCFDTPIRNKTSKWYISENVYPFQIYPSYLSGGSILTNIAVVRSLQIAFQFVKLFDLDDVYVGLVANKLGITLKNTDLFVIDPENENKMRRYAKTTLSNHGFKNITDFFKTWIDIRY